MRGEVIEMPARWRRDTAGFYLVTVILFALFAGWVLAMFLTEPAPWSQREARDTGLVEYALAL